MESVLFKNEHAVQTHIDDPVYLLIRECAVPDEPTPPAFGLAVLPRKKSFLLRDQHGEIVPTEAEEISRAEFYTWARMKVLPVFRGYQRKGINPGTRSATVTHRCRIDYPFNSKNPIAYQL